MIVRIRAVNIQNEPSDFGTAAHVVSAGSKDRPVVAEQDWNLNIATRRAKHDLDAHRVEWTELLEHSAANSIFLTWDWVSVWWSVYGGSSELCLVEARTHDGTLVALAPLRIRRRMLGGQVAEFLGQGGGVTPEYLDFIVRESWEDRALPALLRHIMADPSISGLDLRTIPRDSANLPAVRATLREFGGMRERGQSQCPIIDLPESWEEFLAGKTRNYRKKFREHENRCARELNLTFRRTSRASELRADLDSLRCLHKARWAHRSHAFDDPGNIKFHEDFAQRLLLKDALRLYIIEDDRRAVCALYCFRHGNRIYYYQSGRDPAYARYRLGLVIIHWAIRESIAEGLQVFDLLTGTEEYKRRWATRYARNVRIQCGARGIIETWVEALRHVLNRLVRR